MQVEGLTTVVYELTRRYLKVCCVVLIEIIFMQLIKAGVPSSSANIQSIRPSHHVSVILALLD